MGAGWELGKEALKTVVFKAALGALMPAQPKGAPVQWSGMVDARGNPVPSASGRWPTIQQQVQAARFLSRQAEGRAKVTLFRERMQKLSDAGKAGAPKEEIAQLRSSAEEAYKVVKTDLYAGPSTRWRGRATPKPPPITTLLTGAILPGCRPRWKKSLWRPASTPRNAGLFQLLLERKGRRRPGYGVVEPPRYSLTPPESGFPTRPIRHGEAEPDHPGADGTLRRSSPQELQKAGQEILERSFAKIYGRPSREAMVEFTTSLSPGSLSRPGLAGQQKGRRPPWYSRPTRRGCSRRPTCQDLKSTNFLWVIL